MSIARGLTKAAKAAKKQSRGLTGNRNSQGDFIPEDIQTKGVQEAVAPDKDMQQRTDEVKSKVDKIDSQIAEQEVYVQELKDNQEVALSDVEDLESLYRRKADLLDTLIEDLESNGFEAPDSLYSAQVEAESKSRPNISSDSSDFPF